MKRLAVAVSLMAVLATQMPAEAKSATKAFHEFEFTYWPVTVLTYGLCGPLLLPQTLCQVHRDRLKLNMELEQKYGFHPQVEAKKTFFNRFHFHKKPGKKGFIFTDYTRVK